MLPLIVEDQPHSALAHFRGKLVRGLAHDAPSYSGVGASCKLGAVQTIIIRQVKYLNNILEQDHRFIKRMTGPMMGYKAVHSAAATLAGIETAHMIRKGQFGGSRFTAFQQFAALTA